MTPYPRTCPLVEHHPELLPRRGPEAEAGIDRYLAERVAP